MNTEKSKIVVLLFSVFLLLPTLVRASNCCESLMTSGFEYPVTTYSCDDSATVTKDSCKDSYGLGYSTSAKFQEGAKCDSDKKCVAAVSADDLKSKLKTDLKPLKFTFNVPIPGFDKTLDINGSTFSSYLSQVYKFVLGVCCLLAVFMITLGGLMWIFSGGNPGNVKKAKDYINGAIVGLLFAISSYSILYIINPQLVMNRFPVIPTVQKAELAIMSSDDYKLASGVELKSTPELIALAKSIAKQYNVDYCAVFTILSTESGANPAAIGFDEDVKSGAIGSRKTFVKNGCKQTHGGGVVGNCSVAGDAINDDRCLINFGNAANCPKGKDYYSQKFRSCKQQDLCFDWRYTRGIGIFQSSVWNKCDKNGESTVCVDTGNEKFTPREFLKPENQYKWFAGRWPLDYCPKGSNVHDCWVRYSGSNNEFVAKKDRIYAGCKNSNPQ